MCPVGRIRIVSGGVWRRLAVSLVGVLVLVVAVGCEGGDEAEASGDKVHVTTTTTMITDLVRRVGGERVEVTGLMGPGVDPHLYKASQGDVEALLEADAVFYNGLFLEGQMGEILEKTGQQKPTVAVTEGIPEDELLESVRYEGQADPHVWFDATLWRMTVDPVVRELSELDPEGVEGYERRGEEYKKEIDELHSYVEREISSIPEDRRVLVTAHDAFRYFGRRYGMEVRGLQGISTEAEAGAGDVRRLADYLVENEIPAIFVESSVPRKSVEAVQAACRDRGWELEIGGTLYSDAGGDAGTEAETYTGMFRANVQTITGALK
ncbi:MAG TPA: zinc ABC transporter substrate-binding protein [Rubrobacteraceae bacterium]|nr:zinc ABC transporter substrate-binding protein [Rubrobacteraceae bacterium]